MREIVTRGSGHPVVDALGQMGFQGNIIPRSWYANIKKPSGKPDVVAITLLSEIVWWYRPKEVRDEETLGSRWVKKFDADLLQLS